MNALLRAAAAGGTWAAERTLTASPLGRSTAWRRTNARGRPVSLLTGPALAVGLVAAADLPPPAAAVAGFGAFGIGRYDDLVGAGDAAKGVRGHLAALRAGRVTSGAVKTAGLTAVGLLSCALLPDRPVGTRDRLVDGAIVAGAANLANLLDLRPGRALKAGVVAALLLRQPGIAAAATGVLPADLGERSMLGDAGANALGAVLGLAVVATRPRVRHGALAVLVGLTAASEVVSYSRVIDAVPALRWLDQAGRLP